MASLTNIVVYSSVLFRHGGTVRRWADSLEREFTRYAIALAPVNKRLNKNHGAPGDLKASIRGNVADAGPNQLVTTISVNVPYATYVLHGTTGPIHGNHGQMALPDNSFWGTGHRWEVSGQRANNFMLFAAVRTGRTHSSVRGFFPSI